VRDAHPPSLSLSRFIHHENMLSILSLCHNNSFTVKAIRIPQLTNMTFVCILFLSSLKQAGNISTERLVLVSIAPTDTCGLKTIPSGSEVVLSSGLMTATHSVVYSTFCMSLLCIPPADGYGSQPAVILINGTIKFTASVYFILLMRVCFRSTPPFF